jgi:hypothetical protein
MDFDSHKGALLAHYVAMASIPGAKEAAWQSVQELARKWPQFYGDLPKLLTDEMLRRKSK